MASALDTYNPEILAITCRRCGAEPRRRCIGNVGSQVTAAHKMRIEDAGWRFLAWGIIVRKDWHPPKVLFT